MSRQRVAVWGLGRHALKSILPAFAKARSVDLAGVVSRDRTVVQRIAQSYGCPGWTEPANMLANGAIDAVYVATPTGLHSEHGQAVLRAGKALWCEKPLALDLAGALQLIELSRHADLVLAEAFMYLDHPQFRRLSEVVQSNRLGPVHTVACRFGIPPLENPGFRLDAGLGGSALLDVGSYPISAVTALFPGEPSVLFSEMYSAPGYSIDVGGRAVVRLGSSITAHLDWRIDTAYHADIDIWGDLGSASAERLFSKPADLVTRLRLLDRKAQESWEDCPPADHFALMMDRFSTLAGDAKAAEGERQMMERRARLLDSVRRLSD